MAWTQTDLDLLDVAIATGAKRVRFQTHETEFRTQAEMLELRALMQGELNPVEIVTPVRRTVAQFFPG